MSVRRHDMSAPDACPLVEQLVLLGAAGFDLDEVAVRGSGVGGVGEQGEALLEVVAGRENAGHGHPRTTKAAPKDGLARWTHS